jgi:predicted O-methyltransferase YrrM
MTTALADTFDPRIANTLRRLHRRARGDWSVFLRAVPRAIWFMATGRTAMEAAKPYLKRAYIPVSPDQGEFLYMITRAANARTIVEFGTSFGISALYLGAAAKAQGGRVIGTEMESAKVKAARANIASAGLEGVIDIREGDAFETLKDIEGHIDLLLLDGWKEMYLPMLQELAPRLRPGAVVLADDIKTFKRTLAPYLAFVRDRRNGFESRLLDLGEGLEMSIRLG